MIERPTRACPQFLAEFSDFIDGELAPGRRAEFQAHLDCCEGCLRHLAAYRRGIDAYRARPVVEVDRGDFWLGFQLRLADRPPPVIAAARRRRDWRTPTMVGLATAAMAISVIWTGTRIDLGLREADGERKPVVVVAGPIAATADQRSIGSGSGPQASAGVETALASARPSGGRISLPNRATARDEALSAGGVASGDRALDREFEQLRDRIETEAWLGDPYLSQAEDVSFEPASLDTGPASDVRVETVDVRASEPIPVVWTGRSSFSSP